jgi:hypothetical protein
MNREGKLKIHVICVGLFLVFGHIAMISGMSDPGLLGYHPVHALEIPTAEMPTSHQH